MPHRELNGEQQHIDRAYECLAVMRERARRLTRGELGGTEVDSKIVAAVLEDRYTSLSDRGGPLCFGRIDEDTGARRYIGRRHVKDVDDRTVVMDWRAPMAAPFYRATIRDPLGLHLRRRFILEERRLVDIFEEDFTDPDSVAAGHGGVPDPLLAELGRSRTGGMRDIVATIQAEQDTIIRDPIDNLVIVQGGPGTGKTAIGLHRAAFLLYEHRIRLERDGVLVVGPNTTFLDYISSVLPSLGETSVRHATVEGLFAVRYPVSRSDPPAVAELKGDLRVGRVVRRAAVAQINWPRTDIELRLDGIRVPVGAADVGDAIAEASAQARDLTTGRALFLARFEKLVYEAYLERRGVAADADEFSAMLRRDQDFRRTRDRLWPRTSAATAVAQLLAGGELLDECAAGLLSSDEITLLRSAGRRSGDRKWARSDLPLLDEAEAVIGGPSNLYGHVIVDEAQDMTAMELRMLGRRSVDGSMTVLGDLAQATAIGSQRDWRSAVRALGVPAPVKLHELDTGYRVPEPIIDFANRLLPAAAPNVPIPRAIRSDGRPPSVVRALDGLGTTARTEAVELAARSTTVAVIAGGRALDDVVGAFEAAESNPTWRLGEIVHGVAVLAPGLAKGLEFDAVVVVEPADFMDVAPHGARMLYIAMTRAVQELVVVHDRPIPALLASTEPVSV
jgi:DNA helicase IV